MLPKDDYEKNVWHVLEKIKDKLRYLKPGSTTITYYHYNSITDSSSNSISSEHHILERLEEQEVIKVNMMHTMEFGIMNILEVGEGWATFGKPKRDFDYIEVQQPKFDRFYTEQQKKMTALEQRKKHDGKIIFHLARNGKLSRVLDNGQQQEYVLESTKLKIIEELNEHRQLSAQELSDIIKKSKKYIRTEVGDLRKKLQKNFGIDGKTFLPEPVGENGYTIGETIKIEPE